MWERSDQGKTKRSRSGNNKEEVSLLDVDSNSEPLISNDIKISDRLTSYELEVAHKDIIIG